MKRIGDHRKKVDYSIEVDSDQIRRKIKRGIVQCMVEYPFYGTIIIGLQTKEAPAAMNIRTCATSHSTFYYNKHFINTLNANEVIFVIAHEVMHLVLTHLERRGNRIFKTWTQATDYAINSMLVAAGIGEFPSVGGLYDEQYADTNSEKIYDKLVEDQENNKGGGKGGGGGFEGDPNANFDDHIEVVQDDGYGNKNAGENAVILTEEEMEDLQRMLEGRIISALNAAKQDNKAGQVPAGVQRLIGDLTEPTINWRRLVRSRADSQIKTRHDFNRPQRQAMMRGIIQPRRRIERHFEFTIGIDTSGSISQKVLEDFMSEVYGVSKHFRSFKITVFQYDTRVYNVTVFTEKNIKDLTKYTITGGGGTCFDAAYNYFKEVGHVPEIYFNFTDGYPYNSWGDENYCPTVFIIHDEHAKASRVKGPFGTTVYYEEK